MVKLQHLRRQDTPKKASQGLGLASQFRLPIQLGHLFIDFNPEINTSHIPPHPISYIESINAVNPSACSTF